MSDCARRQIILWVLLGGLPLAALGNLRRSEDPLADAPHDARRDAAADRASGRAPELPARLPPIPITEQSWFVSAEGQLRARGVTYVRLEKWHGSPAVYYFECRLPPDDRRERRPGTMRLTSLSVSPQAAMQDVLRRIALPSPPVGLSRAAVDQRPPGAASSNRR